MKVHSLFLCLVLAGLVATGCANRGKNKLGAGTDPVYDNVRGDALNPYANPNGGGFVEDIPLTGRPDGVNFYGSNVKRNLFPAIYFGFDQYEITSLEYSKIQQVAEYMRSDSSNLILAGHTDSVGTSEYNRNLGELRALAVRSALAQLGVAPNRIQTVSYGEDYPAQPGESEEANSANRRAEFGFYR